MPYVQWDDKHAPKYPNYRGPFSYLPHLFLNETAPVDLGRLWAGDDKELGIISATGIEDETQEGSFSVIGSKHSRFSGQPIVDASWKTLNETWRRLPSYPYFEKHFASGYDLPSIGRYPKNDSTASWKCLPQNYHTTDKMEIMPVSGNMTIHEEFVSSIPEGRFAFPALDPKQSHDTGLATGGFAYRTDWQYTSLHSDCADFEPHLLS